MKFLLISPGYGDIPPKGWKAVEHIVDVYQRKLTSLGHICEFTNTPDINELVNTINDSQADIIHCMYDDYIGPLSFYCNKPILGTCHYGYFSQPPKWQPGYHHIFNGAVSAKGLLHLSIDNGFMAQRGGFMGFSRVLRNGAEVDRFQFRTPSKDVICVGKIEPRKFQSKLAAIMDGKLNIDFVGPMADPQFQYGKTCQYLGEWTRDQLYNNLTDYKTLVLLSDGEGAPLVVPEALSAGLSLVISEHAAANLDTTHPYISVLCENDMQHAGKIEYELQQSILNNKKYRPHIRNYAEQVFDWNVIIKEYLNIINEWKDYVSKI